MKFSEWLKKWSFNKLKINAHFLEMDIEFNDTDKLAAWEMYIELLTRVATQYLPPDDGDEDTALSSIYSLFGITRDILKRFGPNSIQFSKIAIIILNQVIRPFTSKWHKKKLSGELLNPDERIKFRKELIELQGSLVSYTKLLSDIAGVEDLTKLEKMQ